MLLQNRGQKDRFFSAPCPDDFAVLHVEDGLEEPS
jgi:hypothetical protein